MTSAVWFCTLHAVRGSVAAITRFTK